MPRILVRLSLLSHHHSLLRVERSLPAAPLVWIHVTAHPISRISESSISGRSIPPFLMVLCCTTQRCRYLTRRSEPSAGTLELGKRFVRELTGVCIALHAGIPAKVGPSTWCPPRKYRGTATDPSLCAPGADR